MKMYTLVSPYLSGIQKGIQSAHAICELYESYRGLAAEQKIAEWASFHKTIIVLSYGFDKRDLDAILRHLSGSSFPYAIFCEPELNDTKAVAILLDENHVSFLAMAKDTIDTTLSRSDSEVLFSLSKLKLA